MAARVEIEHSDGTVESFPIGAEAVLGRSLEAAISIPDARELGTEHLRFEIAGKKGCNVTVLDGSQAPVLVAGKPFTTGRLPWGAELEVAGLKVRLLADAESGGAGLLLLIALVFFAAAGLGFYIWVTRDTIELDLGSYRDAPDIFVFEAECGREGERALSRAGDLAQAAEAKSDRYAFDPQDGLEAVRLYARAGACYESGGNADAAGRAIRRGEVLQERIREDYTTHRIRLERALDGERYDEALEEAINVHRFVRHTHGEYRTWIVSIIQKLHLAVESEEDED